VRKRRLLWEKRETAGRARDVNVDQIEKTGNRSEELKGKCGAGGEATNRC
jgi:hypothetical protein